jgi:hypothetical protein
LPEDELLTFVFLSELIFLSVLFEELLTFIFLFVLLVVVLLASDAFLFCGDEERLICCDR